MPRQAKTRQSAYSCRTEYAYAKLTTRMLFSKVNFNSACLGQKLSSLCFDFVFIGLALELLKKLCGTAYELLFIFKFCLYTSYVRSMLFDTQLKNAWSVN